MEVGDTALNSYKSWIDSWVRSAVSDVVADRIRKSGHPLRANVDSSPYSAEENAAFVAFSTFSENQKELVAELIEQARVRAHHDALSILEFQAGGGEPKLVFGNEALPSSPFGGFNYDFICRLEGDVWPDDE